MENPPIDPWLAAFHLGIFLASIVVWIQLIARWRRREMILDYEPRRPVPWGPVALVPAFAFVLLALWSGQTAQGVPVEEPSVDPSDAIPNILASMFLQLLLTGFVVLVAVLSQATARDMGLPASPRQFAKDVGIGAVACLAAVAPVFTIQGLLLYLLGHDEPSRHPLVKMLTGGEASISLLIVASAAAAVVAPLCEEIIYRLMLQGWLEKWEDERFGRLAAPADTAIADLDLPTDVEANDEARMTKDEAVTSPTSTFVIGHSSLSTDQPPRGLFGLPHGWFPIILSAALFAAAHFGYGPEPVPIFFLALILGYVYQRTHRIVPTIVAHSLFNLVTMISLWRMVFHPVE